MQNAHFFLHHHSCQETLVEQLIAKTSLEGSGSPFAKSTVLVRNQGMATWIKQQMANERSGIAMLVDFPQPNTFLNSLLDDDSIQKDQLLWKIYNVLPSQLKKPTFRLLGEYLNDENSQQLAQKRYQLASKIAGLFDKYLLYRPQWIAAWSEGNPALDHIHETWQRELWQAIGGKEIHHWAQTILHQRLDLGEAIMPRLPEALHIFGISNFAPVYVYFLYQLSQHIPVHIYWLNPVEGYWGDGPNKRQWILEKAFSNPETILLHNPLLASFGRMGREFAHTIYGGNQAEYLVQEEDLPSPSTEPPASILEGIQRSLRENQPNEFHFENDNSVSIHACHNPLRELETLKDYLLTKSQQGEIDASDILVLCPDIDTYAPAIEAVFGAHNQSSGVALPYRIADRNKPADIPNIAAIGRLLKLNSLRFTNHEALQLLNTPAIRERFDLYEDDFPLVKEWIEKNGIRWGLDSSHISHCIPELESSYWSWRSGLDRLLLGIAMPQSANHDILWNGITPFHDIEGSNLRIVNALCGFLEWCQSIYNDLSKPRSLLLWIQTVRHWIATGYSTSDETQSQLRSLFKSLESLEASADLVTENLPATVFSEHFTEILGGEGTAYGFLTGAITFCEMKPMRAIPSKMICLLGMNYDSFPRNTQDLQFDLTRFDRQEGDRSTRDDDVYFFLETLLSAQKYLFISYQGKSPKDGAPLPPSTALQTLLDHTPGLNELVHEEKLHSFDPAYFEADSPTSFSPSLLDAARQILLSENIIPQLNLKINQPDEARYTTVDNFINALTKPARFFLRQCLQAQMLYLNQPLVEHEPLEADGLVKWQLRHNYLQSREFSTEKLLALQQNSAIPPARIGEGVIEQTIGALKPHLHKLPILKTINIHLEIDNLTMTGGVSVIKDSSPPVAVLVEASDRKPDSQFRLFLAQLLLSYQLKTPVSAELYGLTDGVVTAYSFGENPDYLATLTDMVSLYHDAQKAPLPHFPKTAEAYWSVKPKEEDSSEQIDHKRSAAANFQWFPSYKKTGESEDDAIVKLFNIEEPITEEFLAVSERIWLPLLERRTILEL